MPTEFSHTNIVTRDPERLKAFYMDVFGCEQSGPVRDLHGEWLARGMGLPDAKVYGYHLKLPGQGENGATLEIFSVPDIEPDESRSHNRSGLMHLAFRVDDIKETFERFLAAGGQRLGELSVAPIEGVGRADFVYARDPDGNIVELQQWA